MEFGNISNSLCVIGRILFIAKDISHIVVNVTRPYKNANGEYDTDEFPIYLSEGMATNAANYLKLGDLVGVKGHLECNKYKKDGNVFRQTKIIADKLSLLASKDRGE